MQNIEIAQRLSLSANQARRWWFDVAAPLWSTVGRLENGLLVERLTRDGHPDAVDRRLFVQCRHIYSLCEAGRLGWKGPWQDIVLKCLNYVFSNGVRSDGLLVHKFAPLGGVSDSRADLYDQAFALFALAHVGRVTGDESLFDRAETLIESLDVWRHPSGGYFEGEVVDRNVRRQNPHMHLFEAFSALYIASGRPRFRERAEEIAGLCRDHFIDPATGALLEYFDETLNPASGEAGHIVEPGHCSEWAWLFETLANWGWRDATMISDRLVKFARDHGICETRGIMFNEILTSGQARDFKARLWPQTERMKVALARLRRTGDILELEEAIAAWNGLVLYLDNPIDGIWRDKLTADGNWIEEPSPGSSFYHISCALSELLQTEAYFNDLSA